MCANKQRARLVQQRAQGYSERTTQNKKEKEEKQPREGGRERNTSVCVCTGGENEVVSAMMMCL